MSTTFQDIKAWRKSYEFVLEVYRLTRRFPVEEKFALCQQFQRAAVSIVANIAEGYKKLGKADKLRFMNIAQGSLEECRCYVILSKDLGYITVAEYVSLYQIIEEARKRLNAYCRAIANSTYAGSMSRLGVCRHSVFIYGT